MSNEIPNKSHFRYILKHLIVMEITLGGFILLISVLGGIYLLLIPPPPPIVNNIVDQVQQILQHPLYRMTSILGVISFIFGGIICIIALITLTQPYYQPYHHTPNISPMAYAKMSEREREKISRLQKLRVSWSAHNISLWLLGIIFIIQGFVLIISSGYFV